MKAKHAREAFLSLPLTFTYVNYPATLAGTRWLGEHGDVFEFLSDGMDFTCGCYGSTFRRTLHSMGAFYRMGTDESNQPIYNPEEPFAILPDGDILRVYATRGTLPVLWLTFTRIPD